MRGPLDEAADACLEFVKKLPMEDIDSLLSFYYKSGVAGV